MALGAWSFSRDSQTDGRRGHFSFPENQQACRVPNGSYGRLQHAECKVSQWEPIPFGLPLNHLEKGAAKENTNNPPYCRMRIGHSAG